jgi:intracellular sulfur oxidation DsrE/DsrF family protein
VTNHLVLHLAGSGAAPFPDLKAAARTARNARTELPGTRIEVVVQGPCVRQLIAGTEWAAPIAALIEDGISLAACRNSLRSAGVDESALASGVKVVPAAVAYLASCQFDGAAYIRV